MMKVICTNLRSPSGGDVLESSPWVTLDAEYRVVSLSAQPGGQVLLHIVTDDGRSLALFDSRDFMTVDGTVPASWVAHIGDDGVVELAPASWLAPGFWEAYYDGDPAAAQIVESELRVLCGEDRA